MSGKTKLVEARNLQLTYHTREVETLALKDISFDVYEGEFLTIVGPSGCGKSTVLSLIAGLLSPSSGEVRIGGEKVVQPHPQVAYMLQRDHLFDWRTIAQNVTIGLEVQKKCTPEARSYACGLLQTYGLGGFLKHYPRQLSGGMRQKVALIRTLAVNPSILILDEPFSALDYQTRLSVSGEVADIIRQEKKTAILVTHDISEALSLSDRVIVLSKRPATVKATHEIRFGETYKTPLERRKAPVFQDYFDTIWKELDIDVHQ
ncbi:MAG: ABC transporter ATP-binding protein [Christensenellales bacterium]